MEKTLNLILDKLNNMQEDINTLKDNMNELRVDMNSKIDNLREETKQGIEQLDCNITTTRRVLTEQVYKNTLEIEHLRIVK